MAVTTSKRTLDLGAESHRRRKAQRLTPEQLGEAESVTPDHLRNVEAG